VHLFGRTVLFSQIGFSFVLGRDSRVVLIPRKKGGTRQPFFVSLSCFHFLFFPSHFTIPMTEKLLLQLSITATSLACHARTGQVKNK